MSWVSDGHQNDLIDYYHRVGSYGLARLRTYLDDLQVKSFSAPTARAVPVLLVKEFLDNGADIVYIHLFSFSARKGFREWEHLHT